MLLSHRADAWNSCCEEPPHPPSYLGHPLPWGEGRDQELDESPLPQGRGTNQELNFFHSQCPGGGSCTPRSRMCHAFLFTLGWHGRLGKSRLRLLLGSARPFLHKIENRRYEEDSDRAGGQHPTDYRR